MLVCHCHQVTDRQIRAEVRNGSRDAGQVSRQCRAGTACGGCVRLVKELVLDEVRRALPVEADLASDLAMT